MSPFVTVLIPAYNEEAIIENTVRVVASHLETIADRYSSEMIVINDGSRDSTAQILDRLDDEFDELTVLHHRTNYNLGQALRYGFNEALGQYIVVLDADLSYAPDHIERMLDTAVETGARIVLASPYMKGGKTTAVPRFRELLSRAANRLLGTSAQGNFATVTSMVRCYDRRFIQSLSLKAWDVEVNTEIIYKAQLMRAKMVEIPAHLDWSHQNEFAGVRFSSVRLLRSVASQAFSSFLFRPFMFFILPGLALLALATYTGAFAAYEIWDNWADTTGGLNHRASEAVRAAFDESPLVFVVGGAALLLSVQLITLGLVTAQNKRYFEELFFLGTSQYREVLGDTRRSRRRRLETDDELLD